MCMALITGGFSHFTIYHNLKDHWWSQISRLAYIIIVVQTAGATVLNVVVQP